MSRLTPLFCRQQYFHLLSCDQDLSSVLLGPEQSCSRIHLNSHSHDCVLVTQSRLTLCGPMDCRPPGTVHGILQARRLERVPVLLSRGSSQPQGSNLVYCIAGRFFFYHLSHRGSPSWLSKLILTFWFSKDCLFLYLKINSSLPFTVPIVFLKNQTLQTPPYLFSSTFITSNLSEHSEKWLICVSFYLEPVKSNMVKFWDLLLDLLCFISWSIWFRISFFLEAPSYFIYCGHLLF